MLHSVNKPVPGHASISISSPVFEDKEAIPVKFTREGANISPPLKIKGIPQAAACLAIIMDASEAPVNTFTHWLVWNIPVKHHINEHYTSDLQGVNDLGTISYTGPGEPRGLHHYHFRIFALDRLLNLQPGANRQELEAAMAGHILGSGVLTGYYKSKEAPQANLQGLR